MGAGPSGKLASLHQSPQHPQGAVRSRRGLPPGPQGTANLFRNAEFMHARGWSPWDLLKKCAREDNLRTLGVHLGGLGVVILLMSLPHKPEQQRAGEN